MKSHLHFHLMLCSQCAILAFWLNGISLADLRPNILWITCEDMSPRLACYGDKTAVTPNLDRLATESMRFTHVYGTYGVCAPNRHALITVPGAHIPSTDLHGLESDAMAAALSPSSQCVWTGPFLDESYNGGGDREKLRLHFCLASSKKVVVLLRGYTARCAVKCSSFNLVAESGPIPGIGTKLCQ